MYKVSEAKKALLDLRREINSRLHDNAQDSLGESMGESLQELSAYDNHPADLGSEMFERSKDLAIRDHLSRELNEVDLALKRLQEGTYGECQHCQEFIEDERLRALPTVSLCAGCQREMEAARPDRHPRPMEEGAINMPWGQFATNTTEHPRPEASDDNGFDGEDAWQIVARYGTSETPSDYLMTPEYPVVYPDHDEDVGATEPIDEIPYFKDEEGRIMEDMDGFDDEGPPKRI